MNLPEVIKPGNLGLVALNLERFPRAGNMLFVRAAHPLLHAKLRIGSKSSPEYSITTGNYFEVPDGFTEIYLSTSIPVSAIYLDTDDLLEIWIGSGGVKAKDVAGGIAQVSGVIAEGSGAFTGNPVVIAGKAPTTNLVAIPLVQGGAMRVSPYDASGNALNMANPADGIGEGGGGSVLAVTNFNHLRNQNDWDRQRNNYGEQLLASAARTATTPTADLVNFNARGVILAIEVTASASGGLTPRVQARLPVTGTYSDIWIADVAIGGTGVWIYSLFPGGGGDIEGGLRETNGCPIPRTFRFQITHGDASSWTYSAYMFWCV